MPRLAPLLLFAVLAATPTPPIGSVDPGIDVAAALACRPSAPESHRVAESSLPVEAAEADAAGAGLGLPPAAGASSRSAHTTCVRSSPRPELTVPRPFHLRERAAHPANAPPPPA